MLVNRILAALLMIGGFIFSKAVFKAYPFNVKQLKENENRVTIVILWILAVLIICVQLYFVWQSVRIYF